MGPTVNIEIDAILGSFHLTQTGIPTVKAAIADHLKVLYNQLLTQLKLIQVPTGTGPSGFPLNAAAFPPWLALIESSKLNFPDL